MTNLRRVVILGHSGFIGSHLERHLAQVDASWEVIGRSLPEMDLTNADSLTPLESLCEESTAVVLCAAVKRQFGDTLEVYHRNMAIVENVGQFLAKHPVGRLCFMSSAAVYGEETHDLAISEATPPRPTSFYGIAKFTGECLLRKLLANTSTRLLFLRPPLIYGPGDQGRTYGPAGFCAATREGAPITLWGDGKELREFIDVEDLCRVIQHLLPHEFAGPVNVVSGCRYCFADIVEELIAKGYAPQVGSRPRSKQKADNAFVPDLLRQLLPQDFTFTTLSKGIERLMKPGLLKA